MRTGSKSASAVPLIHAAPNSIDVSGRQLQWVRSVWEFKEARLSPTSERHALFLSQAEVHVFTRDAL